MIFKFTRRYCMAHRLIQGGASSKCGIVHGHNELVIVECRPTAEFKPGPNMSMDFGDAKSVWHDWIDNAVDHSFQLGDEDPLLPWFIENEPHRLPRIMVTPGDPTTEMLLLVFARKFRALCGSALELIRITVEETPTNSVTLDVAFASHTQSFDDQWLLAPANVDHWWDRPDLSINDTRAEKR